jgi:hypothetical protein
MQSNVVDITGQVFGRITAISPTQERRAGQVMWLCSCLCGRQVNIRGGSLRSGGTVSCGCYGGPKPRTADGARLSLLEKRVITDSGCWEWTGTINNQGYGKMGIAHKWSQALDIHP